METMYVYAIHVHVNNYIMEYACINHGFDLSNMLKIKYVNVCKLNECEKACFISFAENCS